MQKNKVRILSTGALQSRLIDEAAIHNIIIDVISFIETKITEDKKINDVIESYIHRNITAIFTSTNAVNAIVKRIKQRPHWKIYCMDNTTKKLVVKHFGEEAVAGIASNAQELGNVMIRDKVRQAVFFCGDQRRDELPEKLKQHNVSIDEIVVYETIETPVLIDSKYDGILFFSPSAVQSFFSINKIDIGTQLFVIGSTTATAIQQFNKNNVVISGSPGKENTVREMMRYYRGSEF